jgi:hypothetical protein
MNHLFIFRTQFDVKLYCILIDFITAFSE